MRPAKEAGPGVFYREFLSQVSEYEGMMDDHSAASGSLPGGHPRLLCTKPGVTQGPFKYAATEIFNGIMRSPDASCG